MAGLASLSERSGAASDSSTSDALLAELDDGGSPIPQSIKRFQYFPETITDTKAVNYQKKEVPGASLPIYQWVNSGERLLTFAAVFTSDTDLIEKDGTLRRALIDRQESTGVGSRNVDVRSAVTWLRRYTLPRYIEGGTETGVPLAKAPPKLMLCMPNSAIGLTGGAEHDGFSPHAIHCLQTQCDVTYEAYFPSGIPRIAVVQLAYVQIAQVGGRVSFPRRDDFEEEGAMLDAVRNRDRFAGYNLVDKSRGIF